MTARFVGSLIRSPNTFSLYGADASNGIGMAEVASAANFYDTKYETWKEANTPWRTWLPPAIIYGLINELGINSTADAYKRGRDWFPTMNRTWKEIIGAGEDTFISIKEDW